MLDLPIAEGKPIGWRVVYERVQALNAPDGHDADLAGSIVLAEGTLGP